MKKFWEILIIFILLILIGFGIYIYIKNKNIENSSYTANKTSTNSSNTSSLEENTVNNSKNSSSNINTNSEKESSSQNFDNQLSIYSTKIYSKEQNRTNNMQITSNKLNNTILKNGDTFSFCNTIGPATSDKGYLEADIFDNNGTKKKGLGGGNCQISSTLYNAVLNVPNLIVTERHPHSNWVPYVPKDKDAAVAYGSYDLKFKNNTGKDIKILSSISDSSVTITLLSN